MYVCMWFYSMKILIYYLTRSVRSLFIACKFQGNLSFFNDCCWFLILLLVGKVLCSSGYESYCNKHNIRSAVRESLGTLGESGNVRIPKSVKIFICTICKLITLTKLEFNATKPFAPYIRKCNSNATCSHAFSSCYWEPNIQSWNFPRRLHYFRSTFQAFDNLIVHIIVIVDYSCFSFILSWLVMAKYCISYSTVRYMVDLIQYLQKPL